MTEREELLRQLFGDAPEPEAPDRQLFLPKPVEIEAFENAEDFKKRLAALFDNMMQLRDRGPTNLSNSDFCRYQLLAILFQAGKATVGECWQPVLAQRGADTLRTFETELTRLLSNGCIIVTDPE